ncbi:ion transporter [Flavisolibacter tropicus]|uniref:ion transporter n=1 Tax=Flavisolibacter tropicus TaxID=1492898 RepID=UPI000ACC61B8|nr:ion transporter [Flavisolibacter tropicus]
MLHPALGNTLADRLLNLFIIVLILSNVLAVMLETVPSIYVSHHLFFHYFDMVSVVIFTVEYGLRIWSATADPRYKHSFYGRLRFMGTNEALINLLAILPFYIHLFIGLDLRALQILRLLRLLRVFHLTSYMKASRLIITVFRSRKNELLLSLALTLFLLIISSCLMFYFEHPAQPNKFTSIPHTFWWSIITLTTVGYGDLIPITIPGRILTGIILLIGVALFALPAGIITSGFLEESRKTKKQLPARCPHCGEELVEQ